MRRTRRGWFLLVVLAAVATMPGWTWAVTIEHEGIECIVAGQFPRFEARVNVDPSAAPRVVFRASGTKDWYQVVMKMGEKGSWEALLPKPSPDTRGIDYYIAAGAARTEEYHPVVSTRTYCENEGGVYAEPVDSDEVALTIALLDWEQSTMPAGFLPDGIRSVMMPDGTMSSAGASSGAPGETATAGSGAGGGLSTWTIIGGLAVAGGIAAASGGGGGGGGGHGGQDVIDWPNGGVLAFVLLWDGSTDLDLVVETPTGCRISRDHPSCDGSLYDDQSHAGCSATSGSASIMIYWMTMPGPPEGEYRVYAREVDACGKPSIDYMIGATNLTDETDWYDHLDGPGTGPVHTYTYP